MTSSNTSLHAAKAARQDEFYTQLVDIEKELWHYRDKFEGKTVFCNCDDPFESNFVRYFAERFDSLGLARLIATSYNGSPIAGTQLSVFDTAAATEPSDSQPPMVIDITGIPDMNDDGRTQIDDLKLLLEKSPQSFYELGGGDGDFRSPESLELLEQADIVVTNPPFSLFKEYLPLLVKSGKQFLVLGNLNAVTYTEIFPLIRAGKLWLGPSITSGDREFQVPAQYEVRSETARTDERGNKYVRVQGVRWFTNLDHGVRHKPLKLYKKYSPEEYPRYDNYDAINVDKVTEIPKDYDGPIGVPISFMHKYCPEQFEILDANDLRLDSSVPSKAHGIVKDKDATVEGGGSMPGSSSNDSWAGAHEGPGSVSGQSPQVRADSHPADPLIGGGGAVASRSDNCRTGAVQANRGTQMLVTPIPLVNGVRKYARVAIRRTDGSTTAASPAPSVSKG